MAAGLPLQHSVQVRPHLPVTRWSTLPTPVSAVSSASCQMQQAISAYLIPAQCSDTAGQDAFSGMKGVN